MKLCLGIKVFKQLKKNTQPLLQGLLGVILSSPLFKGFSWNLAGNLVSKGAIFITSLLAANLLGAENFGRIGIIQQTTGMMITFSVMGLSQTAILFVGRSLTSPNSFKKVVISRVMRIGIVTASLFCLVYLLLVDYIALKVFDDSSLTYLLLICSLVLLGNSINQIQFGILSGLGKFNKIAFTNISIGVFSVPVTYFLMKKLGVEGFVWALVANSWLTFSFNKFFINKEVRAAEKKEEPSAPSYRSLISYAGSNVIGAILFTTSCWFALGVLTRKAGLIDVAAFNASMQIFSILYLVPSILAQVLMSITSQEGFHSKKLRNIVIVTFISISGISIVSSLLSSQILSLYSYELKAYSSVLNWILAIVVIASVINLLDHYANGLGLVKVRIASHIVFASCYIALTIVFVEDAVSLVTMMFAAYCCRVLTLYYLLHNRLRWL